MLKFMLITV